MNTMHDVLLAAMASGTRLDLFLAGSTWWPSATITNVADHLVSVTLDPFSPGEPMVVRHVRLDAITAVEELPAPAVAP